jgi:hypothetical protein
MPLVMGASEVLGDGLGDVGDGDGLAEVGDGDGLADVGDGDGDGLPTGGGEADKHGPGDGTVLLCVVVAPCLADPDRLRLGAPELFSVAPLPLVLPVPFPLLELEVLVPVAFSKPSMNPSRICPRAKTPATTSTTAPATARAGRNQAMAGPAGLCDRLPEAQAVMPPRTGSDLSRPPCFWVSGVLHAMSGASGSAAASAGESAVAERDRSVLKNDSHRTTTNQRSTMNSLRSSHQCRLSHGSLSRPRIFVKPSPTGSS